VSVTKSQPTNISFDVSPLFHLAWQKTNTVAEKGSSQQRLALVIHALSGGGAERVLVDMANHWSQSGVHVTLITLAGAETDVYRTAASIERIGLDVMRESRGLMAAAKNNLGRAGALRRALRKARPDVVISFTDQINVLTLLATLGMRLRVIVCDRVDPRHHPLGRAWSLLRRRLYGRCFAAVVQTEAVGDFVRRLVGNRPVYVIPNAVGPDVPAVDSSSIQAASDVTEHPLRLVAMGRLARQKGFDLLIDAFASLADRHPNWRLDIFGDGPLQDALQQQIARLGLEQRIHLPGWTDDRLAEFSRADLFVLSSRYEGFPNVLLDAMACGLPAVSFDCPSGPAEIIRDRVDGLLVEPEDVDALADALNQLMADDAKRSDYGASATDVLRRFSAERFYVRWQAVFEGAATNDPRFVSAAPTEQD
jgi:glycosyltransferase involved in cell wall biosynthesis